MDLYQCRQAEKMFGYFELMTKLFSLPDFYFLFKLIVTIMLATVETKYPNHHVIKLPHGKDK